MTEPYVQIRTLTDDQLVHFLESPSRFYHTYILKKRHPVRWQSLVQSIIHRAFRYHYKKSSSADDTVKFMMKLFYIIPNTFFDSKIHYYDVVANITQHFVQLVQKNDATPPVLFLEPVSVEHEALQMNMKIFVDVMEWTASSFLVKKYIVSANEEQIDLLYKMMLVCLYEAFEKLPEQIKIVSLFDNRVYTFHPSIEDIEQSTDYLRLVKTLMMEPKQYSGNHTQEAVYLM